MLTVGLVFFPSYSMSKQDQQNWNHIFLISLTQVMHFIRLVGIKQDKYKQYIKL
jgi:hypothetical protein